MVMKYFALLFTFISTAAFASCPLFAPTYIDCQSKLGVTHVQTRNFGPGFIFRFHAGDEIYRSLKFMADDKPRDVTIQTADVGERKYTLSASCREDALHVRMQEEESSDIEETQIWITPNGLNSTTYKNGVLVENLRCLDSN
jgi:hypothetical protein